MLSHKFQFVGPYSTYTWNDSLTMPYTAVKQVSGFGRPELEHQSQPLLGVHGFEDFHSQMGGRFLLFRTRTVAASEASCMTELGLLTRCIQIPTVPTVSNTGYGRLYFWKESDESDKKFVNAKVHAFANPEKDEHIHRARWATFEFRCRDPRIYSATEQSVTLLERYLSGGFPAKFPRLFGSGGLVQNQQTLTNNGNTGSPPTYRLYGPCVNPSLHNITYGYMQKFTVSLAAGEYIEVDVSVPSATHSDGSDALAYEDDSSTWPYVEPGENVFEFRNDTGDGYATVSFRDTFTSAPA